MTVPPESGDWRTRLPWPGAGTHKHARGRLAVISGPAHRTGAARLAARAGLRIGAGLVRVMATSAAIPVLATSLEAVMVEPFDGADDLGHRLREADAVVIGPAAGLGEETVSNLHALARTGAVLVVDADALSVFESHPDDLFASLDRDDVLTPHRGEFARLFPDLAELPPAEAAAQAAVRADAVVLLKGHETVIAAPDGRVAVNPNGTPWLATAGTGDVLAGMIGGLAAQHMDSFDAACAAAWIHAEAARGFGPGLIAEDLPDRLPGVLARLAPEDLRPS
jgi:ADP-dependent NAD(P)H-hydrate dehydratase / NAD(P)H-hydrate epimerase